MKIYFELKRKIKIKNKILKSLLSAINYQLSAIRLFLHCICIVYTETGRLESLDFVLCDF
jgi:hypothetical protein